MKQINFFYDSIKLNRKWYLNIDSTPKSGTEYAISRLAIELSKYFLVNFFCTKLPFDKYYKNIKFKKISSFENICNYIDNDSYLISNYTRENIYSNVILSKNIKKIRHIIWLHNTPDFETFIKLGNSPNVFKFITVSDTQRINLSHLKFFNKIITIPHFVSFKFKKKKIYKIQKQILFIGSLTKSKGFHLLTEVWPAIHKKHPEWKLKVLGSVHLYSNLLKKDPIIKNYEASFLKNIGGSYTKAKNIGIIFEGLVNRKKIFSEILKSQFIIVNPNINGSFETFCISAAQGLILGRPILGGNKGSLPEIVNGGGLLHSSKIKFINNILNLINNRKLSLKLGKIGKKNFNKNFTEKKIINKWILLLSNKEIKNYFQLKIYYIKYMEFLLRSIIRFFFSYNLTRIIIKIKSFFK